MNLGLYVLINFKHLSQGFSLLGCLVGFLGTFFGFLVWWVSFGLYRVLFWVFLVYPLYTLCVLRGALRFLYKTLHKKKNTYHKLKPRN
jgi:hypothetical protein